MYVASSCTARPPHPVVHGIFHAGSVALSRCLRSALLLELLVENVALRCPGGVVAVPNDGLNFDRSVVISCNRSGILPEDVAHDKSEAW